MLRIGEFSKLSHLTVKALRFYEKEGLLAPKAVNERTGYRYYETSQLTVAARIKSFRQLGMTIGETKRLLDGGDTKAILKAKALELRREKAEIDVRLSIINHILEENGMKYQVTAKEIPETIVYYSEVRLAKYSDMMQTVPAIRAEFMALNPGLKCAEPHYEFCEYLDGEHKDSDVLIRRNEAVTEFGRESGNIRFRKLPAAKILSVYHKGTYDEIGGAYAFIMKYAEENGYKTLGLSRECYIDGIWNKASAEDWLTELQLPVE